MDYQGLIQSAGFKPSRFSPSDTWAGHLHFGAWLIKTCKPALFVELGTLAGDSYFVFCQAVRESCLATRAYAVGGWFREGHGGFFDRAGFEELNNYNQEHYGSFSKVIRATLDEAKDHFADRSIDLLHICSMHSYETVQHHFGKWLPKLTEAAVVVFHGTNGQGVNLGVRRFWLELCDRYPLHVEFLHSDGLGMVQLARGKGANRLEWLENASPDRHLISGYFTALGESTAQKLVLEQNLLQRDEVGAALELTLSAYEEQIAGFDQALSNIKGSWSWKVTALLRVCGNIYVKISTSAVRFRPLVALLPRLLRTVGEPRWWLELSEEVVTLLRASGWAGLRQFLACKRRQIEQFVDDYQEWIRQFDTLTDAQRRQIRHCIEGFAARPLLSVLMPVFNPPPQFLDEAIRSVREQLYPDWELCIADDASSDPAVRRVLERHREQDQRIKVIYRKENGHISRASNSALEIAEGDFVALLDHDDVLPEQALFWIADAVNAHPGAGLIYSDEDKIDETCRRYDPYFKCDFNYELLLAQNMICHLGVYRTQLVRELGGFRPGFEGAQDWDLALRAIERLAPDQIVHVPRVLYHWRAIAGSTALAGAGKDYALAAGRKALEEHLKRCGIAAQVLAASEAPAFSRIRFAVPSPRPLVSIIIPTRDRANLLEMCIDSILQRSSYPEYEIIVLDNCSKEGATMQLFERLPRDRVRIERYEVPFNYSALNNHGARIARGELLCLMNNDIEVHSPDWLEEMVSFAVRPDIGAVGARLWYPDGRLQHGGIILGIGGVAGHSHKYLPRGIPGYFGRMVLHQSFSAVTAACLLIRRVVFEKVSGLDEALGVAFNDVDFCLRVRKAGYRNVWTPYAEMQHHESASRGYEDTLFKQSRFVRERHLMEHRWGNALLADPAYNPNLSLVMEDFSLAWPPRIDLLA